MKIALIREKYRSDGGAERIVVRILESLSRQSDVHITLLTRHWAQQETQRQTNLDVVELNTHGKGRLQRHRQFSQAVQDYLRQTPFDLIQSHERIPGVQLYRAGDGAHAEWLATRRRHEGLLSRLSIALSGFHRYMVDNERTLFTHPALQRIVCISELVRDDIQRHYPEVSDQRLQVIYNGIDLERFTPQSNSTCLQARQDLGIPADAMVMLTVGSGFKRKGFASVLEALEKLPTQWHLIMVGKDRQQKTYQKRASQLGVADRVHFTGVVNDPRPYYSTADVLLHPALYEPFGNVILEAMACGTAVCASHRCGGAELIEPGKNGMVCEPADSASIVNALNSIADPVQWAKLGQAAHGTAQAYSLDRMKQDYLDLYQDLLDAS